MFLCISLFSETSSLADPQRRKNNAIPEPFVFAQNKCTSPVSRWRRAGPRTLLDVYFVDRRHFSPPSVQPFISGALDALNKKRHREFAIRESFLGSLYPLLEQLLHQVPLGDGYTGLFGSQVDSIGCILGAGSCTFVLAFCWAVCSELSH